MHKWLHVTSESALMQKLFNGFCFWQMLFIINNHDIMQSKTGSTVIHTAHSHTAAVTQMAGQMDTELERPLLTTRLTAVQHTDGNRMPNFQDQELWKRNGKSYRIIVKQSLQRSIKTTDTTHDPPKELSFGALVGVVAGLLVESVAVSLVCLFFDGEIRIVLVGLVVAGQQVLSQFSSTLFCNQSNHFNNVLFVHEVILVFFFLVFVFFLFLFLS